MRTLLPTLPPAPQDVVMANIRKWQAEAATRKLHQQNREFPHKFNSVRDKFEAKPS